MPDQGIETGVFGYDMKKSGRIFFRELTDVEGDVKIQGVLPVPVDTDVSSFLSQFL